MFGNRNLHAEYSWTDTFPCVMNLFVVHFKHFFTYYNGKNRRLQHIATRHCSTSIDLKKKLYIHRATLKVFSSRIRAQFQNSSTTSEWRISALQYGLAIQQVLRYNITFTDIGGYMQLYHCQQAPSNPDLLMVGRAALKTIHHVYEHVGTGR